MHWQLLARRIRQHLAFVTLALALVAGAATSAHGQAPEPAPVPAPAPVPVPVQGAPLPVEEAPLPVEDDALARRSREVVDDASFGPVLVIEDIEVTGNRSTASSLILRALPVAPGDVLRAGDPRFQRARFKLLATGYFRDVALDLRKGSQPGRVILTVTVAERGTVILNSMYFGTSAATPWWAGLDLSERSVLGTGFGLGAGGVYGRASDIAGAEDQWALELRLDRPALWDSILGMHGALLHVNASEPYRVRGEPESTAVSDFAALPYTRTGGRAGVGVDLTSLTHVSVEGRVERIDADLPAAPMRELPDGTIVPVDMALEPGQSYVVTARVGLDRDTRPDPVLPYTGDRLIVLGELGTSVLGSSYDFILGLARYSQWFPLHGKSHVVSLHLAGGVVLGDAPRFDRLHAADLNRLLTPRAFGLILATSASPDLFGTDAADVTYGEAGGSLVVEYSYQLFRNRGHVYGGDLFVGAGLWALVATRQVAGGEPEHVLAIDPIVDAGLRIDTEIGIFELTLANALGRVPL